MTARQHQRLHQVIHALRARGYGQKRIAKETGTSRATVRRVLSGSQRAGAKVAAHVAPRLAAPVVHRAMRVDPLRQLREVAPDVFADLRLLIAHFGLSTAAKICRVSERTLHQHWTSRYAGNAERFARAFRALPPTKLCPCCHQVVIEP